MRWFPNESVIGSKTGVFPSFNTTKGPLAVMAAVQPATPACPAAGGADVGRGQWGGSSGKQVVAESGRDSNNVC
jgi:hypothetical protein